MVPVTVALRGLVRFYDSDRDACQAHNLFGLGANQRMRKTGPALAAHDYHAGFGLVGDLEDTVHRQTGDEFGFRIGNGFYLRVSAADFLHEVLQHVFGDVLELSHVLSPSLDRVVSRCLAGIMYDVQYEQGSPEQRGEFAGVHERGLGIG